MQRARINSMPRLFPSRCSFGFVAIVLCAALCQGSNDHFRYNCTDCDRSGRNYYGDKCETCDGTGRTTLDPRLARQHKSKPSHAMDKPYSYAADDSSSCSSTTSVDDSSWCSSSSSDRKIEKRMKDGLNVTWAKDYYWTTSNNGPPKKKIVTAYVERFYMYQAGWCLRSRSKVNGLNTFQFTDAVKVNGLDTWTDPESGAEWLLLRLKAYGFAQTNMRNRWIRLYKKGEKYYEDTINFLKYIRLQARNFITNPPKVLMGYITLGGAYGNGAEYYPRNPEESKRILDDILDKTRQQRRLMTRPKTHTIVSEKLLEQIAEAQPM